MKIQEYQAKAILAKHGVAVPRGEVASSAEQAAEIAHQLTDTQVEELVAERTRAKRAKDFSRSDAIRNQLADGGILVEDTKDGVRWKRK